MKIAVDPPHKTDLHDRVQYKLLTSKAIKQKRIEKIQKLNRQQRENVLSFETRKPILGLKMSIKNCVLLNMSKTSKCSYQSSKIDVTYSLLVFLSVLRMQMHQLRYKTNRSLQKVFQNKIFGFFAPEILVK